MQLDRRRLLTAALAAAPGWVLAQDSSPPPASSQGRTVSAAKPSQRVFVESEFAPLRDWDRIEVTEEDALRLGTNGFPVSPSVHITDPEFRHIGEQIAKRGVTVEYVDFAISRGFGGAFRCSTQPLWREA